MSTTTSVPVELVPALRAYRTAELATATRSGAPLAWPVTPVLADDGSSVLLGTAIGFPQKASNIRRDPRVALLFSDPTGSGQPSLPQVLVQGTARCTDEVVTSPVGNERYWSRLWEVQPAGEVYDTNPVSRWLMDWYYMRIMITVTPQRVVVRAPADGGSHLTARDVARDEHDAYAEVVRRLPTYRSAVLSSLDGDGAPQLRRVRPTADGAGRVLRVDHPEDGTLRVGPASLLCHSHDDRMWSLRSMNCLGHLEQRDGGWAFVPERFVPGAATEVAALLRMVRQNRRTARRYLERRQLPRPRIPWSEYAAVKRSPHVPPPSLP